MKKKQTILIVVILLLITGCTIFLCNGCSIGEKSNNEQHSFVGYITSINGNSALVEPVENEPIREKTKKIAMTIKDTDLLFVGNKVKVTYLGDIINTYPSQVNTVSVEKAGKTKSVELYTMLLEDLIKQDEVLNNDMQYIAIDLSKFISIDNIGGELTEEERKDIVFFLSQYSHQVINANYEQLKEEELMDEWGNLQGILITIEDLEIKNNIQVTVNMKKQRSPVGAIIPEYECKFSNDIWSFEITKTAMN